MSAPLSLTGQTPQTASPVPAGQAATRAELAEAAQQFEAIFVRQMLAAARQSNMGDELFGGQGVETFRQMQDDHFADVAAKSGTLGLAALIEAQLSAHMPKEQPGDGI